MISCPESVKEAFFNRMLLFVVVVRLHWMILTALFFFSFGRFSKPPEQQQSRQTVASQQALELFTFPSTFQLYKKKTKTKYTFY